MAKGVQELTRGGLFRDLLPQNNGIIRRYGLLGLRRAWCDCSQGLKQSEGRGLAEFVVSSPNSHPRILSPKEEVIKSWASGDDSARRMGLSAMSLALS